MNSLLTERASSEAPEAPRLSVAIPTLNGGPRLEKLVDALQRQGPSVGSLEILLAGRPPRVFLRASEEETEEKEKRLRAEEEQVAEEMELD